MEIPQINPDVWISVQQTFLGEVLSISTDDFILPDKKVGKDEEAVGEMTDFEKACWTYVKRQEEKIKEENIEASEKGITLLSFPEEARKLIKRYEIICRSIEMINRLMWQSMQVRLGELRGGILGVRKKGMIVNYDKKCLIDYLNYYDTGEFDCNIKFI